MSHLPAAPILIPAFAAALTLALRNGSGGLARSISFGALAATLAAAAALADAAGSGAHLVYALGNWPAPFGIVLVVDRLAALMVLVTAVLALAVGFYAMAQWDTRGPYFHPLLQLQVMGLNGAFLTGDLFNLFVFFEVLLIASYCLLLYGPGALRVRAALHYVVINLAASAMFLIGATLLYGVTGTLNFAQLAERVALAPPEDAALIRSAGLLLTAVFGIKAAVFPLYFWLPQAYAAAAAPVAALFAVMTKVGVYAIARLTLLVFGEHGITAPWLLPVALATLVLSTLGALGAERLGVMIAYLTVNSVGTMLTALAVGGAPGVSAALYYLAHSVLVLATLFLLVELIARQRGAPSDALRTGPALLQPALLGLGFLLAAAMVAGIPPFSGFLGKLMLLQAVSPGAERAAVWSVVLATSLFTVTACVRAGNVLFWKREASPPPSAERTRGAEAGPVAALLACALALAVLAAPAKRYTDAAAAQLLAPRGYVEAVLGATADRAPRPLPREVVK